MPPQPVIVLNPRVQCEGGTNAQINSISAVQAVSELVRSTIGPCAMLKMILDPLGNITLTNDGNCILREIDVVHPSAKHMIELSRVQDEEVGDGTTSVIVLTGSILGSCEALLEDKLHPIVVVRGIYRALEDVLSILPSLSLVNKLDINDETKLKELIATCVGTKLTSIYTTQMIRLACTAVQSIKRHVIEGKAPEIDLKRYAKIEKIPGGQLEESEVLDGIMINKDIIHPMMKRKIKYPRIILLDCPVDYVKPETNFNVEITKATDFEVLVRQEEDYVRSLCATLVTYHPSVVVTEKGVSDLAAHFLARAGVSVLRRLRKTDNNRLARACGATIISTVEELNEEHVGTGCGLFEVRKIGDEYFSYFVECRQPKACSIVLRGASKDLLNEVERNLRDALCVLRNVMINPYIIYGAGAVEMELSVRLMEKSRSLPNPMRRAYQVVAKAFEVIPQTLAQNCGANVTHVMNELRSRHQNAPQGERWGINGLSGEIADVTELRIVEPLEVKLQCFKTAVEASCIMLRIDDVISGIKERETDTTTTSFSHDEPDA